MGSRHAAPGRNRGAGARGTGRGGRATAAGDGRGRRGRSGRVARRARRRGAPFGDPAEIEHLEAALEIDPDGPHRVALALARITHGRADPVELCADVPPTVDDAVALATQALERGPDPEGIAYFRACATLVRCDRLALARVHLEHALEHARRFGSVPALVRAEVWLAVAALHTGELEAAIAHATIALGAGRHTTLAGPARATLTLALIERDGATDPLDDADTPELLHARGRLRLARWDTSGALEDFLAARDPWLPWRSGAALAGAPEALACEEHAAATRFGAPRAIGMALRALAAVGPPSLRTERCRDAVAVLAASEARLEYGHALCDLGASLRRERARRNAREPLREALDIAVRCGATALARRVREELAASGARPRRLAQSGRDALTPAELRVAGLAARGLANREIAQSLFVTVKTVETELGHAYAKLGIRSRRDLADALAQS